jgi:hypothetical protein
MLSAGGAAVVSNELLNGLAIAASYHEMALLGPIFPYGKLKNRYAR